MLGLFGIRFFASKSPEKVQAKTALQATTNCTQNPRANPKITEM